MKRVASGPELSTPERLEFLDPLNSFLWVLKYLAWTFDSKTFWICSTWNAKIIHDEFCTDYVKPLTYPILDFYFCATEPICIVTSCPIPAAGSPGCIWELETLSRQKQMVCCASHTFIARGFRVKLALVHFFLR